MPMAFRIALLLGGLLCGGFVALLGGAFSQAVEPESYSTSTAAFWVAAGAAVVAPLWIPAMVPSRYVIALKVCRWLGALVLLVPTTLFGSIVVHNIDRSISGLGAASPALAQRAVLTVTCLLCLTVLLWPERRTGAKRTT